MSTAHLAGVVREQARGCLPASPLTHALLQGAAADLEAGGVSASVLADELDAPPGSVPGLRLAAALHHLVLTRAAPRLAMHYPSVGGSARPATLWADAAQVLAVHGAQVRARMAATVVQTNEIGRSAPLWGGLQVAAQRAGGLGLRLLEVGASGGLNLRPDRIGLVVDGEVLGDAGSPLRLEAAWTGRPPAELATPLRVGHRAGCDVHPVDVATAEGRLHLSSFVWPDDAPRWERLRGALALAVTEPVAVQALSGSDFLAAELARAHPGELTVVWHSVVWQYVSAAERERGRAVLVRAAAAATTDAPLALLVLEPVRATGVTCEAPGHRGRGWGVDPVAVVFLVVGGLGVLVLLASLVVGEIGDLLAGDADGPFSLPALAALVGGTGFGGAAAVALLPELPRPLTVLLALAAGLVVAVPLALGTVRFSAALQHMPTDATLTRGHLLGSVGTVVSAIPGGGLGEVRVSVAGQQLKYYARSEIPLPAGTGIYVVDTPTETTVQVVSTEHDTPPHPGGPSS